MILEDLPEDFAAALAKYNRNAEENFGQFLKSVSRLVNMPDRFRLPLSKVGKCYEIHFCEIVGREVAFR